MNIFQQLFDVHVIFLLLNMKENMHTKGMNVIVYFFLKIKLWLNIWHYRRTYSLFFRVDCFDFIIISAEHVIHNNP